MPDLAGPIASLFPNLKAGHDHVFDRHSSPLESKSGSNPGRDRSFRRRVLSVGAFNGNVYVIGGMQPDGGVSTETAVFHPQSDTWTEGPRFPGEDMEGFGTACLSLGDRLYVSTSSGKVLCLSHDGESWERVKNLQAGRFFHRMLSMDGQHLVILGGASMKSGGFSEVEVLKINAWAPGTRGRCHLVAQQLKVTARS